MKIWSFTIQYNSFPGLLISQDLFKAPECSFCSRTWKDTEGQQCVVEGMEERALSATKLQSLIRVKENGIFAANGAMPWFISLEQKGTDEIHSKVEKISWLPVRRRISRPHPSRWPTCDCRRLWRGKTLRFLGRKNVFCGGGGVSIKQWNAG